MTRRDLVHQGFEQSRAYVGLILASIVAAVNVISTLVMLALSGWMSVTLWPRQSREKPDREPAWEVDMEGPITPDEIQQAQLSSMQRAGAFR